MIPLGRSASGEHALPRRKQALLWSVPPFHVTPVRGEDFR